MTMTQASRATVFDTFFAELQGFSYSEPVSRVAAQLINYVSTATTEETHFDTDAKTAQRKGQNINTALDILRDILSTPSLFNQTIDKINVEKIRARQGTKAKFFSSKSSRLLNIINTAKKATPPSSDKEIELQAIANKEAAFKLINNFFKRPITREEIIDKLISSKTPYLPGYRKLCETKQDQDQEEIRFQLYLVTCRLVNLYTRMYRLSSVLVHEHLLSQNQLDEIANLIHKLDNKNDPHDRIASVFLSNALTLIGTLSHWAFSIDRDLTKLAKRVYKQFEYLALAINPGFDYPLFEKNDLGTYRLRLLANNFKEQVMKKGLPEDRAHTIATLITHLAYDKTMSQKENKAAGETCGKIITELVKNSRLSTIAILEKQKINANNLPKTKNVLAKVEEKLKASNATPASTQQKLPDSKISEIKKTIESYTSQAIRAKPSTTQSTQIKKKQSAQVKISAIPPKTPKHSA